MNFDRKLFTYLIAGFIAAVVIGTLTHECGHYLTAKALGYDATINYAFTQFNNTENIQAAEDDLLIISGGPLLTILIGISGLLLLIVNWKSFFHSQSLNFFQWFLIIITLFLLRPAVNLAVLVSELLIHGKFSKAGDEIRLAEHYNLPGLSLLFISAFFGLIVFATIFFFFVSAQQRLTFFLSAIVGGCIGYILWLIILGPVLMPAV